MGRLGGTSKTLLTDHTSCVLQQFNGGLLPETRRGKRSKEKPERHRQGEREKETGRKEGSDGDYEINSDVKNIK